MLAYLEGGRPGDAAGEFERIAASPGETPEVQREALWRAADLFEKSGQAARAMANYENYVKRFPAPLDDAMEARLKLADHARDTQDPARRRTWLDAMIAADREAGGARTDRSRYLAARAMLEVTSIARDQFNAIALVAPLKQSLASKKSAMEHAIAGYQASIDYSVAEVTTAATYEMGELYRRLAADLMSSERPANLDAEAIEQYDLLLEEQAFPFEEKAADVHGLNAARAVDGLYDEWVRKSYAVLAELEPARYGKTLEAEPFLAQIAPPAVATVPAATAAALPAKDPAAAMPAEPLVPPAVTQEFAQAVQMLQAGDLANALPLLERLVATAPAFAEPAINLGWLHVRETRAVEAQASFEEALRRDPKAAAAYNGIAALHLAAGRFRDAESAYRQSLAVAPDHALTHRNFAVLLDLYLRQPAEALRHFEAYLAMTGASDKQVSGWIAELKRRVGNMEPPAGVVS